MPGPNESPTAHSDVSALTREAVLQEFRDFEIAGELGQGSMGIVFAARRRSDGRQVALKILPPSLTLTSRATARFQRAAALLTKVEHPAIVRGYEYGQRGQWHYFAMEHVDGTTLEERLAVGPLPVRQAAEIAATIGRALHFAHDRGVLHRDLKPANVMLRRDGSVAITDFGLARETGDGSMTESGAIVGTPMYMAPEQAIGDRRSIGICSDVYGLGSCLYHLVTGTPAFHADSAQGVLRAVLDHDPEPPRRRRHDLPVALEAIILKGMEKDPADRYGSALEMAEDLERFLTGQRGRAPRRAMARRAWRAVRRRPALSAMTATVVALAAGAIALLDQQRQSQRLAMLQSAETELAIAARVRDDQQRPVTRERRERHLTMAATLASRAIAVDPGKPEGYLIRAHAHHRLAEFDAALADLDAAERRGGISTKLLYLRIDTLRRVGGDSNRGRLLQDLIQLVETDASPYTHGLVAEHLIDMATATSDAEQSELLDHVDRVLALSSENDARAALAKARALELRDQPAAALAALHAVCVRFRGNPLVHYQAAEMFGRLGQLRQAETESDLARQLDPHFQSNGHASDNTELDVVELKGFLQQLDSLMEAIGGQTEGREG